MQVIKRNGSFEDVSLDKVLNRIKHQSNGLNVDFVEVAKQVCGRICNNINTFELDNFAGELCSSMIPIHPDYGVLGARLVISNHHKRTSPSFSETMTMLYNNVNEMGENKSLINYEFYNFVMDNKDKINNYIDYSRDFLIDYFGFKTLEKAYLFKLSNGVIIERPQHLWMRVALAIHHGDIKDALETYDMLSTKKYIHGSPTLYNAGTKKQQFSSCFLLDMQDSIESIFDIVKECALISQEAGGIGINVHDIRAKGASIRDIAGVGDGVVPMLKVFNDTARYVNQLGRRPGSIAVYLEPWHADILDFLELKKNHGEENLRARDLFYALWVCDLFMKRVQENGNWSLMCPHNCKGLTSCYGDEFEKLYIDYENKGMFVKQIPAQLLWDRILTSQIETGTPYITYKDSVNRKNNQSNLGLIKSSNLCNEILEHTSEDETAVCNLASICLPEFVKNNDNGTFYDFDELHKVVKIATKNLNKIIDFNFYPVEKARRSNFRHRPIGIGVQGLADTFFKMRFPFASNEAKQLNKDIFETMYHASLEASMELALKRKELYFEKLDLENNNSDDPQIILRNKQRIKYINNHLKLNEYEINNLENQYIGAYSSFYGSPLSQGKFQFDLWDVNPSNRYDWNDLRTKIRKHGVRNSLLIALMPTASTSQIMGNNECFEPITSNQYTRRTLSGEFIIFNKYLVNDLITLGIWNEDMRDKIKLFNGSIQEISEIPNHIKLLYKTAWEIKTKPIIDLAADRAPFVCQTQSMNLFVDFPSRQGLTKTHFYGWKKGLKTGIYYLRTKTVANAQKFGLDAARVKELMEQNSNMDCENCGA
jgi:ribonucleoside-diphosphate reductase alpha chain